MKNFKQYLSESAKEHKLTIRFACELEDEDLDRLERFLGKYDLRNMSRVSETPITKNPAFFDEEITNTKVGKIDITTGYPVSQDILRQQISDLLNLHLKRVLVHREGWEPKEEIEKKNDKPLLGNEETSESDNGKTYGRTFVDNFLKSLTKKEMTTIENELSVKGKSDPAPAQMPTDEKPSKSVISGGKK
jgi:hypothetical protein